MEQPTIIKELINQGDITQAIAILERHLADDDSVIQKEEVYYLLGNAYRKTGNWKQALDHYQHAIDINPDSPATHARKMVIDILEFYHKDMYNQ